MCRALGITTWPYRKDTLPLSTVQPDGSTAADHTLRYTSNLGSQYPGYESSFGAGQMLLQDPRPPATAIASAGIYPDQKDVAALMSRIQSQAMPALNGNLWGSSSQIGLPPPAPPLVAPPELSLPPVEEETLLQRMCRDATPESLISLLDQVKTFSAE